MKNKSNDATPQRPDGNRLIDAAIVTIDLPSFIEQIRQEAPWKDTDRNAITLFKTNGMRIVLIALHAGTEMKTHTADGIISVQVIEGRMKFNANNQSVELDKGQMLTLHQGIQHSVQAVSETIFLLTLTSTLEDK